MESPMTSQALRHHETTITRHLNNAKEFRETIETFFEKILPDIGHALNDRINDNFQKL